MHINVCECEWLGNPTEAVGLTPVSITRTPTGRDQSVSEMPGIEVNDHVWAVLMYIFCTKNKQEVLFANFPFMDIPRSHRKFRTYTDRPNTTFLV